MHARAELQEARAQTQRLQEAAQEAEMGHADQVEMLRKQQAALVQRCKEADTQLQEIMYGVRSTWACLPTIPLLDQRLDCNTHPLPSTGCKYKRHKRCTP